MSMERHEAIKHFSARKYAGMTIGEAFAACPQAVRNGLAAEDHQWVKRFPDVPAHDAGARLAARNRQNPDGTISVARGRTSEGKDARIELRCTHEQKAKAAARGAALGITASAYLLGLLDAAP